MSVQIIQGNALAIPLADQSVHTVVTSPPYWGLRDYGVEGQLGLESTFDEYLGNMLKVFAEVHRVLRDDGTLWLNMGDGYAGSGKGPSNSAKEQSNKATLVTNHGRNAAQFACGQAQTKWQPVPATMKPKDMIGQPWALAFALRADGWYLRSDIIWAKPAPMPESCRDRPTKSHEYLFLLTKREHYFFDQAAWLEPCTGEAHPRGDGVNPKAAPKDVGRESAGLRNSTRFGRGAGFREKQNESFSSTVRNVVTKRNRRTVWTIGSQPTPEAHFATFPEALVEPCLLAGCPSRICPKCGTGWEPIEEKTRSFESGSGRAGNLPAGKNGAAMQGGGETGDVRRGPTLTRELKGYAKGCACEIQNSANQKCAGTVFDPFSGSGTVCAVANRMGYNGIGLELNPDYIEIAKRRIFADVTQTPAEKAKGQRMVFA